MKNFIFLKDYFIGFLIFFIPASITFKTSNLRQLSSIDVYLFLITLFIIFIFLIIFNLFFKFILNKINGSKFKYSFSLLCLGYLILFLFLPLHNLLFQFFPPKFGGTSIIVGFLLFLWIIFIYLFLKFNKFTIFFFRSFLIFGALNFLMACYFIASYQFEIFYENENLTEIINLNSTDINTNNDLSNKIKIKPNIYYIIVDGMINLKNAEKLNIINQNKIINNLSLDNLKYIKNSFSNYNVTYLTLASILNLNYPINELSKKYINRKNFFPYMMYQNQSEIPLPKLLKNLDINFVWVGNNWGPCVELVSQPWVCTHNKYIKNIMRLGSTIFYNTPMKMILMKLIPSINKGDQRVILDFVDNYLPNIDNTSNFFFIHHLSPHGPYKVSSSCEEVPRFIDNKEGYKASYLCVLNEISYFMKYIKDNDPNALVVFQSDHGQKSHLMFGDKDFQKIVEQKNLLNFSSDIFNAIKVPDKCNNNLHIPLTNINTIRFVLNCAYDLDIKYIDNIHYHAFYEDEILYGQVLKKRPN